MTTPTSDYPTFAPDKLQDGLVDGAAGFRGLRLARFYDSGHVALHSFYVPVLSRAISYDRSVGYFHASAISAAAIGISRFIANGGKLRLLIGAELEDSDKEALLGNGEVPAEFGERLATQLVPEQEVEKRRLEVLAWMAQQGRLCVKVVVPVSKYEGNPLLPRHKRPIFHEKVGILRDAYGDGIAFQGSVNEGVTAWTDNFESFGVYCTWNKGSDWFDDCASSFVDRWGGYVPGYKVFDLPEAVLQRLLSHSTGERPHFRDPEEGPEPPPPNILATFLSVAPKLVHSEGLAEATSGIKALPHQQKVVARLAGTYPRSWLVVDEVGLGKTISAGLALRQLVLDGRVKRSLVLAPAGVCKQWQDELFEKFGLWVPRLEGDRVCGAHPDDVRFLRTGENPYDSDEPILLASSHLARRRDHQAKILAARPFDLLVVDEAHHARRRAADYDKYRPSRLLELLDGVDAKARARAIWLLTATPMQIDPIELVDLLRHVGLSGRLTDPYAFENYYANLGQNDASKTNWHTLAVGIASSDSPLDEADKVVFDRITSALGPVNAERIRSFGDDPGQAAGIASDLGEVGQFHLRQWLHQRGPIGRHLTRHTRHTLRRYYDEGLMEDRVPDRDVESVPIEFEQVEQDLYDDLDTVLDRLNQAHGARKHAGLVLTVYRRRLTSSWAAIRTTISRRLATEGALLSLAQQSSADEELDTDEDVPVDERAAVPLTKADLEELNGYLERLETVPDSKFEHLRRDLDNARGNGEGVIVFTAYTDTLTYLRDRLFPSYRSHLATYTGEGGQIWSEESGNWQSVPKANLVDALMSRRVSVILATDAASEGLNLQAASYLINFDLPWNPMRVEQRIGRIDRVGQQAPLIKVRNYVIPDTIEVDVYDALSSRIDIFAGLVGKLQPILGATEEAFEEVFKAPKSEREAAKKQAIDMLNVRIDELKESGIDFDMDDDPMPVLAEAPAPVTLTGMQVAVVDDLGGGLDEESRPATFDPKLVSRDLQDWCALATYGHPRLQKLLEGVGTTDEPGLIGSIAFAQAGDIWAAYRADRTPPSPVCSLDDLIDLGDPVAAGEALALADQAARDAAAEREERLREAERSSYETWLASMRRRYISLVHDTINAISALNARSAGEGYEPRIIWMNLIRQPGAWGNLQPLMEHLDLTVVDVVPREPAKEDPRSDDELASVPDQKAKELTALVKEWMAGTRAQPEPS